MPARKTGTASRTRTSTPRTTRSKRTVRERVLALGSAKRWSTRRVAVITTAGVMFASNPVTIMAAVNWVTTTVNDWHTAATTTGLI